MKKLPIGIIVCIFCACIVAGFVFARRSPVTPIQRRLVDRCPNEKRLPVEKKPAVITQGARGLRIAHAIYRFSFEIPKDSFRFEENTLQEYEEPIYLPTYLYSMLLTFGQTRVENHMAPYEIRFIVYPSWCNSEKDWVMFMQQHGWSDISVSNETPMFTTIEKIQSGRTYRRMFVHDNSVHYEFETSWDNTVASADASDSAKRIFESFMVTGKEEKQ